MYTNDNNTVTTLKLSSMLFFAPFVHYIIHHKNFAISSTQKKSINGYITHGYINIILLLLFITSSVFNYLQPTTLTSLLSNISLIVIMISIITGIGMIATNQELSNDQSREIYRKGLIYFIPGYSQYQRYKNKKYQHPYRWNKESLLRWSLLSLILLSGHNILISIIGSLFLIRVITLFMGLDLIKKEWKKAINSSFHHHTEEVRPNLLERIFPQSKTKKSLAYQQYNHATSSHQTQTIIEYMIWALIIGSITYYALLQRQQQVIAPVQIVGIILIISKIIIRHHHKQDTYIPVIHEILDIFLQESQKHFTSPTTSQNDNNK